MHHKLVSARLGNKKALTSVDATTSDEETPRADNGKKQQKHVPLDVGLAKIVSLELATEEDEDSTKKSAGGLSNAAPKATQATTSADSTAESLTSGTQQQESRRLHQSAAVGVQVPLVNSYLHHVPLNTAALVAARMAEEQEAIALYLNQRQHQSHLQMEQIRRMQAAMLLYHHAAAPSTAALPYLESLIASRQVTEKLASEMFPAHHSASVALQLNQSVGSVEPKSAKVVTSTAASSGANPKLLSLAPKRELEKPIKERPEEYQHLSKKAKRLPPPPPSSSLSDQQPAHKSSGGGGTDQDDDDSSCSDPEKNGHRFRPYQYEQWTEKFQELCDFRKQKGHCQVPHTYKDNPPLARWVKRQRYQYKLKVEGKLSTMTDERVQLLENIGFIWDSHAAAWAEKLHELKDYARQRGDCNVPSTYPDNPQLATWVKCQRRQYKLLRDGKTSNMTVDRILELEKVGFVWEVRKTWEASANGMERLSNAVAAQSS